VGWLRVTAAATSFPGGAEQLSHAEALATGTPSPGIGPHPSAPVDRFQELQNRFRYLVVLNVASAQFVRDAGAILIDAGTTLCITIGVPTIVVGLISLLAELRD
jgi:hypothetical protein